MPQKESYGFSLLELLVVIAIISVLLTTSVSVLNPPLLIAKAHDSKRLADLSVLSSVISEYIVDYGVPPGSLLLHLSDDLPEGQVGPLQSANTGWIEGPFSKYTRMLYTDPKNEGDFVYRYKHDNFSYELDCALEALTEKYTSDSGNSNFRYEVGTNLSIL